MSCSFGSYDRRITFQEISESRTATGSASKSWGNLASTPTVWAWVRYLRGEEYTNAALHLEAISNQLIRVRAHYRSDISTKNRIVYNSKNWDILSVAEVGYKEEIEILAEYNP